MCQQGSNTLGLRNINCGVASPLPPHGRQASVNVYWPFVLCLGGDCIVTVGSQPCLAVEYWLNQQLVDCFYFGNV